MPGSAAYPRVTSTAAASTVRITTVRIRVARSGFTFSTPTLANIAVRAANTADISAHACQEAIARLLDSAPRSFTQVPAGSIDSQAAALTAAASRTTFRQAS